MSPQIKFSPYILDWMQKEIETSQKIYLFSAFLTKSGFSLISPHIFSFLKNGGELFLVTGFFRGITDLEPLFTCLYWADMGLRINTYISLIRNFHAKFYLFQSNCFFSFSSGSSNLTTNGLKSCGEINTILSGIDINGQTAKELTKIISYFIELSVPLDKSILDRYEEKRQSLIKAYASGKEQSKTFILDRILQQKTILSSDYSFWEEKKK